MSPFFTFLEKKRKNSLRKTLTVFGGGKKKTFGNLIPLQRDDNLNE